MIKTPMLLFLGDVPDAMHAKTASGIAYWRPESVKAQMRFPDCPADLGLPDMTFEEAVAAGVKTLVIGVASAGGVLPEHWIPYMESALGAGLDIANGLHTRLSDLPRLQKVAQASGREIFDVRFPSRNFPVGTGKPRSGKRLLSVGTDCAVGKMFSTLALEREMRRRGMPVDFRATGQTGILIAGTGVSVDAIVADFISGAAEWLSPDNDEDHWDVIEGQGSLFHPSYAGVSMGLLHGSQPHAIVVCHDALRDQIHTDDVMGFDVPTLSDCIALNLEIGSLTNNRIRCVGVSVNTSGMKEAAARDYLSRTEDELQLPCVDPVRTGVVDIVDRLEQENWN